MAETKIEWARFTFNPWIGCAKVPGHPGCANCYAEADFDLRKSFAKWGPDGTRRRTSLENWKFPGRWNRAAVAQAITFNVSVAIEAAIAEGRRCAIHPVDVPFFQNYFANSREQISIPTAARALKNLERLGVLEAVDRMDDSWRVAAQYTRPRVFCASLADVFEDYVGGPVRDADGPIFNCPACGAISGVPSDCDCEAGLRFVPVTLGDLRRKLGSLIRDTAALDWLLLTKRPQNVAKMAAEELGLDRDPANVWILTSVSNQKTYDSAALEMAKLRDRFRVLGLSIEPLLGPIDLGPMIEIFDWVIVGGESGDRARPMAGSWARSLRDQCAAAGVAFHFKQWGEFVPIDVAPAGSVPALEQYGETFARPGKAAAGRLLDGETFDQLPDASLAGLSRVG